MRCSIIGRARRGWWIVRWSCRAGGVAGFVAKGSPAWSLRDDLEAAKVELLPISRRSIRRRGDLYDAADRGPGAHIGQPELDAAVAGRIVATMATHGCGRAARRVWTFRRWWR